MIKGEAISLRIDALDDEGAGVGTLGDGGAARRVHVAFALPGERVEARIEHESPHRPEAWALLDRVVAPSPDRVEPSCAAWGRCGACVLQHLGYDLQLEEKQLRLAGALADAGVALPDGGMRAFVRSPLLLGWRNRSKLACARASLGRVALGGYAPRSHEVVDLAGCRVVEPPLERVADSLRTLADRLGVRPYDEATGEGDLRHVILRINVGGEVLALFVVARRNGHNLAALARVLREASPEVVGVVENLQDGRGNAIVGDREPDLILDGVQAIEERVGTVRLRLSARSFFQVNRQVAQRLYAEVAAELALAPGDRAVDVYSGVGGIALTLAERGADVTGIEENPQAVADARAGADLNGRANAHFSAGDAAALLAEIHARGERAAAVVLNPPRKGCALEVLRHAAALAPRAIAYVSCDPASLARDLALLAPLGYRPLHLTPFDMIPHSPHLEALALLGQ